MEITTRTNGTCPILDLHGQLFLGPATRTLRNAFSKVFKKNPTKIVVNMQHVTHMDTSGLGELIECHSRARVLGHNLVLLNPREKMMHQLIVTKLETVFDIFHDETLAVNSSGQKKVGT